MNVKKNTPAYFLIYFIFSLVLPNHSKATGDSYANIKLVPLAINQNNEILFKTKSHFNKMGANTYAGLKFGWLVASAKGIWDEEVHYQMHIDDNFDQLNRRDKSFRERKDLSNPPDSLQKLIKKYHFEQAKTLPPTQGNGQVTWDPAQLCHMDICTDQTIEQRSLEEFESLKNHGLPVSSSFFFAGVALFHNKAGHENELYPEPNIGAILTNNQEFESLPDSTVVDGIALLLAPTTANTPNVYTSKNLGFSITKPEDWVFTQTKEILEDTDPTENEKKIFKALLARHPKVRLVTLTKDPDREDGLSPDFKVTLYPVGNFKHQKAAIILGAISAATKNVLTNFQVQQEITRTNVSGLDAAYTQFTYNAKLINGKTIINRSKIWVVLLNDNNFFLLSGSVRQDGKNGTFAEIENIFGSIEFE